ncbi:MAG TPA: LAGLIDADG family homing endonuclease [Nitrososphaera sp.]|nr:LAGLIDADG family homing endonuclease [Nitrososphaera sp.]
MKSSYTKNLPLQELACTAGLIDGEGCIAINKVTQKSYKRLGFQLRISVCMTHEPTVRRLHEFFGGSFCRTPRERRKTAYQWAQSANGALDTIKILRPWLMVKEPQAIIALRFQENRSTNKTDVEWQREYEMYQEMAELNRRWSVEDAN